MNINNIRIIKQNIIPLLFVPIILSGCVKKSDCTLPNRHIHLYKKTISVNDPNNPNDDIAINRYIYGENLSFFNYKQTLNAININKDDEKYINLIAEKELFLGSDNWNYLYDVMKKNSKDHLEYYYDYEEKKTYYEETQINWISGPVGTGHGLRQGQRHGHLYTETSTLTKVNQ